MGICLWLERTKKKKGGNDRRGVVKGTRCRNRETTSSLTHFVSLRDLKCCKAQFAKGQTTSLLARV